MAARRLTVRVDDVTFVVEVPPPGSDGVRRVRVDGAPVEVDARLPASGAGSLLVDGRSHVVERVVEPEGLRLWVDGEPFLVRVEDPSRRRRGPGADASAAGGERVVAPMPGKVVAVLVEVGHAVVAGAGLVVLEAMKMENELRARGPGTVAEVLVAVGQTVNAGDLLIVIG